MFSLALLALTELTKYLLHFDKLIYNSLAENLSLSQIERFFKMQDKWKWLGYVFVPLFVFVKTIIIASVVYTGIFFFIKKPPTFKEIWNIVLKAEFIFLLVPICKIVWFYFFQTNYKLEDLQYFFPLSAINITGYNGLESWLVYPLQSLNLFEFAYVIYLGYEIGKITQTNHDNGLKIMAYSYVPMMVLWVAVVSADPADVG